MELEFALYEKYLEYIDGKIAKFFNQASPYIFCKEGCSFCCKKGAYPFSHLEFRYLLFGSLSLKPEEMLTIDKNVDKLKELQKQNSEDVFYYECPFLINNKCSVYKHRGLICRSHGLVFYLQETKELRVPACVDEGLNYSSVYDKKTKIFSKNMFEKTGIKDEPVAYNLSLKFLLNNDATKALDLNFGENKPLIDWFQ